MTHEAVRVVKENGREVRTFVTLGELGAEMSIADFLSLVVEIYGSPAMTFTRAGLLSGLQAAADQAIQHMKNQTGAVAAVNLEPLPKKA